MAIEGFVDVIETQLWPQLDARDPLGLFGWRMTLAGTGTGGSSKVFVQVPASKRNAFVYAIYSMIVAQIVGAAAADNVKMRILTGWPNIDPQAGVQAYGDLYIGAVNGSTNFTPPNNGIFDQHAFPGNARFLLCFDPSTQQGNLVIAEQEISTNITGKTWVFEGWGYYWDRGVLNTPGGPRHPGSS